VPDPVPDGIPQVLAEIQAGEGLSPAAAGRLFTGHRGGKSVAPSTPFRWITKGAKAADGRVVKLEAVRVGGRWLTSRAAVGRFVAALTTGPPADPTSFDRTPSARRRASEHADAALEKMGA
jgi:hypothetical protein